MAGDIPNFVLTVDADGTAHATTTAHYVNLVSDNNSVFSNRGTSLVIHAVAVKCLRAYRRESHAEYHEAVAGGLKSHSNDVYRTRVSDALPVKREVRAILLAIPVRHLKNARGHHIATRSSGLR